MTKNKRPEPVVETITPEKAVLYLSKNYCGNRKIKVSAVASYVDDMRRGNWHEYSTCFDPIVFDTDGNLRNGQHRLNAIIESGTIQRLWVQRGADPADFEYYDNGKARNVSDYMNGYKNIHSLRALAAIALCVEDGNGNFTQALQGRKLVTSHDRSNYLQPTRSELLEYIEQNNEELQKAIRVGCRMYGMTGSHIPSTAYSAFYWLVKWLGEDHLLDEFVEDFCTDVGSHNTVAVKLYFGKLPKLVNTEIRKCAVGNLLYCYENYGKKDVKSFTKQVATLNKYEKKVEQKRKENRK